MSGHPAAAGKPVPAQNADRAGVVPARRGDRAHNSGHLANQYHRRSGSAHAPAGSAGNAGPRYRPVVIGGLSWLAIPAVAAATCGRFSRTPILAVTGAAACVIAGLTLVSVDPCQSGNTFPVLVIAPCPRFSPTAQRRGSRS